MASKTLSKDQQNFIWISIACVDFLKLPLKDVLSNQIKPADLYHRINGKGYLRKEQLNICFIPPPGEPDYNNFDVTLLYTLIRNLCSTSLSPTQGWGKVPDSSHTQIGDDIERLRLMRNKFAHANSAGIPDAEFQVLWNDLKSVIQRIQKFMNSMGSNVNYEQKLADIERNDFGYGDLQKYTRFLDATLNLLKEERAKDEPEISIKGAGRVVWGEKTCFKADLKQKEIHWSISWQRVRGSVTNQIDVSKEKYRNSTRTQLVIHSVCKDDEGEYQAVLARESNGNKRKIESKAIFLHVDGELPVFKVWKVTAGMESVTIHYKVKNNAPRVFDIRWIMNGEGLDFKTQKYVGGGLLDNYLTITSPNEADKGTYSCTLTNAVGCTSKDVIFDIPKATISTESKVYLGLKTQIKAKFSSFLPPIESEWQKSVDGNEFHCININERKYHGSDFLKNPLLVIKNTTFDDILYYRLLMRNIIGVCVSNTVYLNVTGNPPNVTCSHETCFETRSVKLIAKVYLYDTCHEVQEVFWTVNDEEIDKQGLGEKFSKVSVDSPCLIINNVNRYDAGSYKLTATNAVGSTISDAIELNIPEVIFAKFDEKEDGTQWFTVTIKSIPEPFLVQWRKREKKDDTFQPINVNADDFKGSSCSFPHPLLVIKQKEQLENFYFQIKIKNFIGTCKKTIQDLSNLVPGAMKLEDVSSDEINDGSMNETYDDEIAGIKFAILFDDLADHFPEEKFQKLKDLIQSSKKVKNIKPLNEAKSARDCFRILDSENLFTKLDVTFVQFLLRKTECKELENKCAEYAKGQKALGFYEKQPEDGFKNVHFHVLGDLSNFSKEKRRNIKKTVAAIVGCKTDRVFLNGYRHSESFIAIVSIEVIYVGKLVALKKQDRYKFVHLDIDYFTLDFIKVISKLSQDRQRVEYFQKTEKYTSMSPKQSTFVPSRVRDDMSLISMHRMADDVPLEICLDSQRDDYYEHIQKTDKHMFLPHKRRAVRQSRGRNYKSLSRTRRMAVNIGNERLLSTIKGLKAGTYVEASSDFRFSTNVTDNPRMLRKESTFVPSRVRDDMSLINMRKMAALDPIETCLELSSPKRFKYYAHLMSSINVSTFGIEHISCFEPNRLWLSTGNIIKEIDEEGHLLRELSVDLTHAGYHTLTKAGELLFKKNGDIYMLSLSGEIRNLHIQASIFSCIHSSRLNGDIFVTQEGLIKRYNERGVKLQTITTFLDTINIYERFLKQRNEHNSSYKKPICNITENLNGDIIVTSNIKRNVVACMSNGKHKFTYSGLHNRSVLDPTGICIDTFGHILVGDSCLNDPCIHLLDKNGKFLAKLLTHQLQDLEFNALCVDERNNLYVWCKNRINVYTYLPDTTITKHDTKVIDSEMKPNVLRI